MSSTCWAKCNTVCSGAEGRLLQGDEVFYGPIKGFYKARCTRISHERISFFFPLWATMKHSLLRILWNIWAKGGCLYVCHACAYVCTHTHKHTCPPTHGDLSSHHWPEAWLKEAALGWRWAPSAVVLGRLRLTYPRFTNEEMTLQSPLGRAGRGERRVGSSYNVWLCHHET